MLGAALTLSDLDCARRLIAFFTERPTGHMPPYWRAHLARGQGLVAAAEADLQEAEARLRDATRRFAEIDSVYWRSVAEVELADVLGRLGRGCEAAAPQASATALLEQLGAAGPVGATARGRNKP